MKVSLFSPFHNQEKNLPRFFAAIAKLDYPHADFEISLTDDASTDDSLRVVREFQKSSDIRTKVVQFTEKKGVALAAEAAIKNATYDFCLGVGLKCEIFPDVLRQIEKIGTEYPIIGITPRKENNIYSRFFDNLVGKIFNGSYQEGFADFFITEKNFDHVAKGSGAFFFDRKLYLSCQVPNSDSPHCSDDTKLLWNMIKKTKILKTAKVRMYYNTRTSFLDNLAHIYARGPKFIDYYFHPGKRFFGILLSVLFVAILSLFAIITGTYLKVLLLIFLLFDIAIAVYCCRRMQDFFAFLVLFPIFGFTFFLGIIKGIFLKVFH